MIDAINIWAKEFTPLVNLLLTTLLVLVTAVYAFLTFRMWREMVQARELAVRPSINIDAKSPTLAKGDLQDNPYLSLDLRVENFGRGPAYNLSISADVPWVKTGQPPNRLAMSFRETPPTLVRPGEIVAVQCEALMRADTSASKRDFLKVEATYRDADGGVYSLVQSYDLRVVADPEGQSPSRWWQMRTEEWRFSTFASSMDRRHPRAEGVLLSRYGISESADWDWKAFQSKGSGSTVG